MGCVENLDLCAMRCSMRKKHKKVQLDIVPDEVTGKPFPSAYQSEGIIS